MKLQDIDFRIWNNEDTTYEHPSNIIRILQDKYSGKDVSKYSIELFTGFIAKNGKKIYEGDILQRDVRKYLVRYVEDESGLEIVELSNEGYVFFVSEICNELEIIGNIHENKDLLKE